MDEEGNTVPQTTKVEPGPDEDEPDIGNVIIDYVPEPRKYYFDGGHVEIAAHIVYELDANGKQLRVVQYTDYARDQVRTLYKDAEDLRSKWADAAQRADIIAALEDRGIDLDRVRVETKQVDADALDLICHLAFNAPLRTRCERAERLRRDRKDFFDQYGDDARLILEELLAKYADHGITEFKIPDVLKIPPISDRGNVL
jgi:type I restriction enzyme R subunit